MMEGKMSNKIKLPKLPHGQGSMDIVNNGKAIRYRKNIRISETGEIITLSVTKKTPQECMKAMFELENKTKMNYPQASKEILYDAMCNWLEITKRPVLKPSSFRALRDTINNHIRKSKIGHFRYQSITSDEIRLFLIALNQQELSYSTIKKCYYALTDFYGDKSYEHNFKNPMIPVKLISYQNVKKKKKDIAFFDEDDIKKFIKTAVLTYKTGRPVYKYECGIAANIFLGLRIGELLALQWSDINFEKKKIRVNKTLIIDDEDDYDYYKDRENPNKKKTKIVVQNETKTSKTRFVPINPDAYELIMMHYERCDFKEPDDFVFSSCNRKHASGSTIDESILLIEKRAKTSVIYSGTHLLRHTCASLMFKNGVPVEIIATILGNSREVCEKVYVHFIDEQKENAVIAMLNYGSFLS